MPTHPARPNDTAHEVAGLIGYDTTLRIVERARLAPGSSLHRIRLRLELTPPAERHGIPLAGKIVGLQDLDRVVHQGTPIERTDPLGVDCDETGPETDPTARKPHTRRGLCWETLVVLAKDPAGPIRWLGSTVHGPKDDRFLYLAWPEDSADWGGMRIKVQLRYAESLIPKIIKSRNPLLSADVTGRVPHDSTPVPWKVI